MPTTKSSANRTSPAPKRIPSFATIEEEAKFWDTHDSSEFETEFKEVTNVKFVRAGSRRAVTIQLDQSVFEALATRAHQDDVSVTDLVEQILSDELQAPAD